MTAASRLPRLTLEFFRGHGFLAADPFEAMPGVEVVDLRVEVPGITFPFSLSQSGSSFANVRTIVRECELRIDLAVAALPVLALVERRLGLALELVTSAGGLRLEVAVLVGEPRAASFNLAISGAPRGRIELCPSTTPDERQNDLATAIADALVDVLRGVALVGAPAASEAGTTTIDVVRQSVARPFLARGYKLPATESLGAPALTLDGMQLRVVVGERAGAGSTLVPRAATLATPQLAAIAQLAEGVALPENLRGDPTRDVAALRAIARGAAICSRVDLRTAALRALLLVPGGGGHAVESELRAVDAALRADRVASSDIAAAAIDSLASGCDRTVSAHLQAAALEFVMLLARRTELTAARERLSELLRTTGGDDALAVDLLVRCGALDDLSFVVSTFGDHAATSPSGADSMRTVAAQVARAWSGQSHAHSAKKLIERAVALGPADADLIAALERAWLADRDETGLAERLGVLLRSARNDAERAVVAIALSDAHARLGRREESARALRHALSAVPGDRGALVRAMERLDPDEAALASRALADAVRDPVERADLLGALGERALDEDQIDEALRWFRLAADLAPDGRFADRVASCMARMESTESAVRSLPARSTIGRNLERTRALLERAQAIVEAPSPVAAAVHPTAAVARALAASSQKKRLTALRQLVSADARDDQASALIALALDPSTDPETDEALELASRAWALAPEMLVGVDDAIVLIEEFARERDDHAMLADLYARRLARATSEHDRVRLTLLQAGELRELGRTDAALALLAGAELDAASSDGTVERLRAQILAQADRHEQALHAWERAVEQLPPDGWEHVEALRGAAAAALKAGLADHEERLQAAICAAVPGDRHALDRWRRLADRRGDHHALIRVELRALSTELSRTSPFGATDEVDDRAVEGRATPVEAAATLARLAQAVACVGELAEARRLAMMATRWCPDLPETFEARAAIERRAGDQRALAAALEALLPHLLRLEERRAVIDELAALHAAPSTPAAPTAVRPSPQLAHGDELDAIARSSGLEAALSALESLLMKTREPAARGALLLRKGRWMLATGRPARDAVLVLKGALILDGGTPSTRIELLIALVEAGEPAAAAEQARALLDVSPPGDVDAARVRSALSSWALDEDGARHAELRERMSRWLDEPQASR